MSADKERKETNGYATVTPIAATSIHIPWRDIAVLVAVGVAVLYFICYVGGAL